MKKYTPILRLILSLIALCSCAPMRGVRGVPLTQKHATRTPSKQIDTPKIDTPNNNGKLGTVNILDFGAIPNDDKDDAAAIQKALKYAYENKISTVMMPAGRFLIQSHSVNIFGNVAVVGSEDNITKQKTVIYGSTSDAYFVGFAYDYNNFTIKNITFLHTTATNTTGFAVLKFAFSQNRFNNAIKISNCFFGQGTNAIWSERNAETIENCTFDRCYSALRLSGSRNTSLTNNIFKEVTNGCILLTNQPISINGTTVTDAFANTNIVITKNWFDKPQHCYPIHFATNKGVESVYKNIVIANNKVDGVYRVAGRDTIAVPYTNCNMPCPDKKASNCFVDENGTADQISVHHHTEGLILFGNTTVYSGDMGITLMNCDGAVVANNTSSKNTASGITLHACLNTVIAYNRFLDNGHNEFNTKNPCTSYFSHAGVMIGNPYSSATVAGNLLFKNNTFSTGKPSLGQKYNISVIDNALKTICLEETQVSLADITSQNKRIPVNLTEVKDQSRSVLCSKSQYSVPIAAKVIQVTAEKTLLTFTHQNSTKLYDNTYYIHVSNPKNTNITLNLTNNLPIQGQKSYTVSGKNINLMLYYDNITQEYKVLQ